MKKIALKKMLNLSLIVYQKLPCSVNKPLPKLFILVFITSEYPTLLSISEQAHEILVLIKCLSINKSGESAQMHRLTRTLLLPFTKFERK